ncbi:hypothetical protein NE237_021188 [Protea cynaroides]|uniref:Uncharacterized protein n=1 Tax=Protea cynaroides TaxID=273540 RepID=A0A9Q0K4M4_9MAGN|nr:hypothetical protein NE237_021188 [Protea cynaroides]
MTGYRGTPRYATPEVWMPFPMTHSFGMIRNNNPNLSESQEWLPRWTWEMFQKGELMQLCGLKERDKEKVERMCLVALWCVQHSPVARPPMSTVVKILGEGVEIVPPPNPFQYLVSACLDSAMLVEDNGE